MERKLKLRRWVISGLYILLIITVLTGAFMISSSMKKQDSYQEEPAEEEYVSDTVISDSIPTISSTKVMSKPYLDEDVKIGKNYYDYKAEAESQEKAITYYNGSYIQNSGIDYVKEDSFDVVSVLDGIVTNVKEDEVLGTVVEIKHDDNYISTYQSLKEVTVKKDDTVTQGQVIGKSGTNKLDKDMGNHLHFELYVNGQIVDPSLYIDKEVKTNKDQEQ